MKLRLKSGAVVGPDAPEELAGEVAEALAAVSACPHTFIAAKLGGSEFRCCDCPAQWEQLPLLPLRGDDLCDNCGRLADPRPKEEVRTFKCPACHRSQPVNAVGPLVAEVRALRAELAAGRARESAACESIKRLLKRPTRILPEEWCQTCRAPRLQLGTDGDVYDGPCHCPPEGA